MFNFVSLKFIKMKEYLILASVFIAFQVSAQKKTPENWYTKDPKADKIYGAGVDQALQTLKGKTTKTVIVAVIDSGTDIEHEDLKEIIWTNKGEVPDNGIDDDKNGYVDDVHGWSFLGGKNGDINYESTELARLYHTMSKKFKAVDETKLSGDEAKEYEKYKKIKNSFTEEQTKQEQQLQQITIISGFLNNVKKQNNGSLSKSAFKAYTPQTEMETRLKKALKLVFALGMDPKELEQQLVEGEKVYGNMVKYNQMNADSIRASTVGDDPNDYTNRYYGCNRVEGPDALHGTHVAGIIAAVRNNNIGINGMASNVLIMPVRAVPNGDERDKDVANAIRYAVDNGASIINMSFGKYYFANKQYVDDAVLYAKSKDVLLIHAAGNDAKNKDAEDSYPTRILSDGSIASNWMDVGASGYKKSKKIIADFSNYGSKTVDLFAPGVDIYSTVPDNKYINESGTSMASPSTAGVAALIRGYFPELSAEQVKEVLMKTVVPYKKKVLLPGSKKTKVKVKDICISGGFINANNAVKELMGLNKK